MSDTVVHTAAEPGFAEEAILKLLTAADAPPQLAGVIGDRMYPVVLPDDVRPPALVYSQLEDAVIHTQDGAVPNGHVFEVAVVAAQFGDAKKAARAVRGALNGKTVSVDGDTTQLYVSYLKERDPEFNPDRELFIIGLEFKAR